MTDNKELTDIANRRLNGLRSFIKILCPRKRGYNKILHLTLCPGLLFTTGVILQNFVKLNRDCWYKKSRIRQTETDRKSLTENLIVTCHISFVTRYLSPITSGKRKQPQTPPLLTAPLSIVGWLKRGSWPKSINNESQRPKKIIVAIFFYHFWANTAINETNVLCKLFPKESIDWFE